jgi:nucleotide-binding universal stress UspA family protein
MSRPVFLRLLLATEHGDFDRGAEALALALARRSGLHLKGVLPVASNPEFEAVAPQLAARSDADAAERRDRLQAQARELGVIIDVRVRRGADGFAEIVDEARRTKSDLIVIRRRGRRGLLANLLVGEMVSKVVAHAPCSVLIAPRGATLWSRCVLVGLDPLAADASLVAQAAAIADDFGLPLHITSVAANEAGRSAAEDTLAAMRATCGIGPEGSVEVRVGRPHHELIAAAAERGADLIVIARHGRDVLDRAWIGGVAQKVIGLAECPVLVHIPSNESTTP